jgi:hypothetical protein
MFFWLNAASARSSLYHTPSAIVSKPPVLRIRYVIVVGLIQAVSFTSRRAESGYKSTIPGKHRPVPSLKLFAFLGQHTIFQIQVFRQPPHCVQLVVGSQIGEQA